MNDYYKVLEVDRNASQEVIRAAYRALAKKYHPDKSVLENAIEKMQEINVAYGVLSIEELKKEYDKKLIQETTEESIINNQKTYNKTTESNLYKQQNFKEDRVEDSVDAQATSQQEYSVKYLRKTKKPILNLFLYSILVFFIFDFVFNISQNNLSKKLITEIISMFK
jgi:DnaJ-class molecular chaperone